MFSINQLFFGSVLLCFCVTLSFADLGISDPTRPVYKQLSTSGVAVHSEVENKISSTIPQLNQLVFSQSRQVAIFGDLIVQEGDETDFGKIVDIKKDRVLVMMKDGIHEIILTLDDPKNID